MRTVMIEYGTCPHCLGTGQAPVYIDPEQGGQGETCFVCSGSGKIMKSEHCLPDGWFFTSRIIEATEVSDYNNLSASNKDRYKMIISAGCVDLSDGTNIRTALQNMFAGTTTLSNLQALVES